MNTRDSRNRYSSDSPPQVLHRFFVAAPDIEDEQVVMSGRQAHQICKVLRLKPGDHFVALDNRGQEYQTELTEVTCDQVKGQVVQKRLATGEPKVRITLYQSLLAREKFEWVLQKCTEVGVSRFVPVITQRSVVRKANSVKEEKLTRWRRIITEAAEQSHRGRIPEMASPVDLQNALNQLGRFDLTLLASPDAQDNTLRDSLGRCDTIDSAALLIGPEGGFVPEEIEQCVSKGAAAFTMGPRVLRTETAAVVASSLILYELGEMNV
jgi:16S rRNA (uracil1498-N3)-methyltransferase